MLVLAYLLRTNVDWQEAEVRLKLAVKTEEAAKEARASLRRWWETSGSERSCSTSSSRGRPFREVLGIGLGRRRHRLPGDGAARRGRNFRQYYDRLQEMSEGLPPTAFVLADGTLEFSEVLVDPGLDSPRCKRFRRRRSTPPASSIVPTTSARWRRGSSPIWCCWRRTRSTTSRTPGASVPSSPAGNSTAGRSSTGYWPRSRQLSNRLRVDGEARRVPQFVRSHDPRQSDMFEKPRTPIDE
jgi:hypothetical protein